MTADEKLLEFSCPLCRSNNCYYVVVRRPNGVIYKTEFFQCAGCSVMFTEPERFKRLFRDTFDGKRRIIEPTRDVPPEQET